MNWNKRYADTSSVDQEDPSGLSQMAKDLNSHIFSYVNKSGQNATDRMYKGNNGSDLDNQEQLQKLRTKYNDKSTGSVGKAVQQIKLFTGKQSYGSDIRTNREKFPEFHTLMDNATPIAGGLARGTILTDVRHGTPGQPININDHFKVGDKTTTQVTSATSDPNLASAWVLDDKKRFDDAKQSGDNSVLDDKYNGARNAAYVVHHYPEGIKGLQVAPLSEVPEHNEVVPQAGQKLTVSKVTGPDENGVHHVFYDHDKEDGGPNLPPNMIKVKSGTKWSRRYANELPRDPSEELPLPLSNREMEQHLIEDHSDILTNVGNLNWDLRKNKILDKIRKMTFEEKQKYHKQLHGPMGGFTHGTTHEHGEG